MKLALAGIVSQDGTHVVMGADLWKHNWKYEDFTSCESCTCPQCRAHGAAQCARVVTVRSATCDGTAINANDFLAHVFADASGAESGVSVASFSNCDSFEYGPWPSLPDPLPFSACVCLEVFSGSCRLSRTCA